MNTPKKETVAALAWLSADNRRTMYAASKKFNISASTLSRAVRRELARGECPTCGQTVYDAEVLKSGVKK